MRHQALCIWMARLLNFFFISYINIYTFNIYLYYITHIFIFIATYTTFEPDTY